MHNSWLCVEQMRGRDSDHQYLSFSAAPRELLWLVIPAGLQLHLAVGRQPNSCFTDAFHTLRSSIEDDKRQESRLLKNVQGNYS